MSEEMDSKMKSLGDYIVNGMEIAIVNLVNGLTEHTLAGLNEQNKLLSQQLKMVQEEYMQGRDALKVVHKQYSELVHSHNLDAGAWTQLKLALETRIHQLEMERLPNIVARSSLEDDDKKGIKGQIEPKWHRGRMD